MERIMYFVDMPSLLMVIASVPLTLLLTGGFKTFVQAINAITSKKYMLPEADRLRAVSLFRTLARSVFAAAAVSMVVGIVLLLQSLSEPSLLGPYAAITLLTIFYAGLINLLFFYPAIYILENRGQEEKTGQDKQRGRGI